MTTLDIQWFRDRIGQTVIRSYDGREVEFEVTEKNCGYLQLFSQKGYTFRVKPRVHSGPPESTCTSCEG